MPERVSEEEKEPSSGSLSNVKTQSVPSKTSNLTSVHTRLCDGRGRAMQQCQRDSWEERETWVPAPALVGRASQGDSLGLSFPPGNGAMALFTASFARALHFMPSRSLCRGSAEHPIAFHAGVLVAGPLPRWLMGEAAPTLWEPAW